MSAFEKILEELTRPNLTALVSEIWDYIHMLPNIADNRIKDRLNIYFGTIFKKFSLTAKKIKNPFIAKVEELSGQNLLACYQCGKCSAGCPAVSQMDILPNQIIRYAQLGFKDELLKSKSIWICASCFTCTSRCPKGVDLAKVMEALRLLLLRKSTNYVEPSELDIDENLPQIALVSNFRKMTG